MIAEFPEDDIPEEIRYAVARQNRDAARSGQSIDMLTGPDMQAFKEIFGNIPGELGDMA